MPASHTAAAQNAAAGAVAQTAAVVAAEDTAAGTALDEVGMPEARNAAGEALPSVVVDQQAAAAATGMHSAALEVLPTLLPAAKHLAAQVDDPYTAADAANQRHNQAGAKTEAAAGSHAGADEAAETGGQPGSRFGDKQEVPTLLDAAAWHLCNAPRGASR
jgi:hypothetical protein